MTPTEYKEKLQDALRTSSYEEYADIARETMHEYLSFAMDELKELCDENVTENTLWIWVYALRQTADRLDSKNNLLGNLMDNFGKFINAVFEANGTAKCNKEENVK